MPPIFGEDPYAAPDRLFQVCARTEWEATPEDRRSEVLSAVADWPLGGSWTLARVRIKMPDPRWSFWMEGL